MTRLLTLPLLTAALLLTACNSTQTAAVDEHEDKTKCMAPKPGVITSVNATCAIMHDEPVDPELTTEWKGQKVGFCCKGCIPKWNKLTAAQKDAALAAATPNAANR
ncbi:MAG: hypothetical protein QM783_11585 [Phycisphaerales bacterium]